MAFLGSESRGLIAAGSELPEEDEPMPSFLRRRTRHSWTLGIVLAGALGVVALGGMAARASKGAGASLRGEKALRDVEVFDEESMPPVGGLSTPRNASAKIQGLVDGFKADAQRMLKNQGWDFDLEPFEAQSYCTQVVAGTNYVVKVKAGAVDKAVQLTIFEPLPLHGQNNSNPKSTLTVASVVAAEDKSCQATPASARAPPLPHEVQEATSTVQSIIESVKDQVPALLKTGGWADLPLDKYKALSFCTDGMNYIVKVALQIQGILEEEEKNHPEGIFLQLLVRDPSEAETAAGAKASLFGAMMVTPVPGNCASLPVLPHATLEVLPPVPVPLPAVNATELKLPEMKVPELNLKLPEPEVDVNKTASPPAPKDDPQRLLEDEAKADGNGTSEATGLVVPPLPGLPKPKPIALPDMPALPKPVPLPTLPTMAPLKPLPTVKPLELPPLPKMPEMKPLPLPGVTVKPEAPAIADDNVTEAEDKAEEADE